MQPTRRSFLASALAAAAFGQQRSQTGLAFLTIREAGNLVRAKRVSPVDLVNACLERIDQYQPSLNCFITITRESALEEARAAEREIRGGIYKGPLHGIPLALKDNIDTAGVRTTAASNVFRDRVPTEDAEVVRRLKAQGAVFLGKLNLHEFAYGGTSAVTAFGPVHNPWNRDLTPGGSSGGPGVAVAAGLCYGSLGTDTAGSVRIPASYCGITGLMPTYGRVSIRGVIPLSWTLDHVGPMTRSVEDTAILLQAVAGYDAADTTTADVPVPDYVRALKTPIQKLRLGTPRKPFFDALHPDVQKAVDQALDVLRKLTAGIKDVQLPPVNGGPVLGADAYAYHAAFFAKTPELYQPPVRAAIERSREIRVDAYARALRDVAQARRDIGKFFSDVDAILLPTMADPPFRIEEGLTKNVSARNTSVFDLLGIPMISIPCGFTQQGLPIGLQIGAAPWAEPTILALSHAYEQATDWQKRHPTL
jgi:aspartyl-tRNA(Asn)/glutamyl-tRNA(Gln) amidotransferase subunit A